MTRLSERAVGSALTNLPDWQNNGTALEKQFRFKTFRAAMAFANQVAEIATESRHHPDILIRYNRVSLTLTTHDEGGVTEKDVEFAKQVEARHTDH